MAKVRRRCSEAFIVQGAWWEPANPDQQLTGALTWSPDSGGELDVLGFFHDDSGTLGDWRADVLHGVAEGDEFTLINCVETGSTLPSAGLNRQRIRANGGVLAGALIPDVVQPVFDRVTVELDYLAELSGRSTPEHHIEWSDDRHVERVWIEYELPREVVADMADESVRLASEPQFGGGLGHAEINETVVFSVDVREPLPLREIVGRYVPRLRDLVTLAAQQPSAIRSVRVAGPATTETRDDGRVVKRSAEFLAPFLPTPKDPAQVKRLTEALILLPADDRSFRTLIRRWFELAERLGPVLDLRFAPGYASFVYAESRFLNAAQAIEALHRRVLSPVYEDHLKSVSVKLGRTIARADDFFTNDQIVNEIWTALVNTKLVIADCTQRNPNVFYEIGLAHAIGKPTILITQNSDDIPFDLRHRRYLQYELTPRGMKSFEGSLEKTINTVLAEESSAAEG